APDYVLFWGHHAPKNGRVGKHVFSQWYPAPFLVEGESFATAEHYMMAAKATLFSDADSRVRILADPDPKNAKAPGRTVRDFQPELWDAHAFDLVVAGNSAKFQQNAELGAFLRSTGGAVLVEASPVDAVWAIGLAADDPASRNPDLWKGKNLLGFAL